MINDKLKNKSIYLYHYNLLKSQTEPKYDQSNRFIVGQNYRTLQKNLEQSEFEAFKKSEQNAFTLNSFSKLRKDYELKRTNEIRNINSAMNKDKFIKRDNIKSSFINKQNNTMNCSQQSYLDALRLYRKQKFLEEYMKINGDAASQIIPNFLLLGGHNSIKNANELSCQGVTHVLNMAKELKLNTQEYSNKNIKILQIGAKDIDMYNIRPDFDLAFMFIDDCLRSRGKIIVNCARGISRSATIVIAYLMFRYNLRLNQSYTLVSSLRPQVRPNSGFRSILAIYDLELEYARIYRLNQMVKLKQTPSNTIYQTQAVYSQN